jgi:hypothetical protein
MIPSSTRAIIFGSRAARAFPLAWGKNLVYRSISQSARKLRLFGEKTSFTGRRLCAH